MAIQPLHDLHKRRFGRNVGVGLVLVAFVALVFALTVVKVTRGDPMQAFDHTLRPEMLPAEGEATAIPTQSAPASAAAPSTAPAPTAPASSAPAAAQEAPAP